MYIFFLYEFFDTLSEIIVPSGKVDPLLDQSEQILNWIPPNQKISEATISTPLA